jgi:hypothetical protein
MNQNDLLAADAVNTFLVDFGETITYTPYQSSPITIQALINRNVITGIPGLTGATSYKHEVEIANDPTYGRTSINKGKDSVTMNNVVGGTTETFVVLQIVENDAGMFRLGIG